MSNTAFATSAAKAFITSPAFARGRFAAGLKTAHALVPYLGFGNVVNADGSCSTNPALGFLYTKKTVTVEWSYSGQWVKGPAIDTSPDDVFHPPQPLPGGGPYDGSFPPEPAAIVPSNFLGTRNYQYFPWFDITGTAIAQHYAETGDVLTLPPFSANQSPMGIFWNNQPPPAAPNFFFPEFIPTNSSYSATVSGQTATQVFNGTDFLLLEGTLYLIAPAEVASNNWFGQEVGAFTIVTTYSVPMTIAQLEAIAQTMLGQIQLTDVNQCYYAFDAAPAILLNWNPVIGTYPFGQYAVFRTPVTNGIVGAFSRIAIVDPDVNNNASYTDTTAIVGQSYCYEVTVVFGTTGQASNQVIVSATAPIPNLLPTPPAAFFPSAPTSPRFSAPTGLIATLLPFQLSYTTIANELNPNSQLIVFPIDVNADFAISRNVSCGIANSFFLSAFMPLNEPDCPVAVTIAGTPQGYIFSKTRGFLPGNNALNAHPSTYQQKFKFVPATAAGNGAAQDITATETARVNGGSTPITFPNGLFAGQPWVLTRELPATIESFTFTDLPGNGFLYWD
jgi:hypothetical protein